MEHVKVVYDEGSRNMTTEIVIPYSELESTKQDLKEWGYNLHSVKSFKEESNG